METPRLDNQFSILHLNELPEPAIVTDTKHSVTAINQAASVLLDYSAEEVVGWPLEKIFPRRPAGIDLMAGRGTGATEMKARLRPRSGKPILASFLVSPVVRAGEVVAMVYLGRDIRVHSLVDEEVKRARDYFRAVIRCAPIGLCITDLNRNVILLNKEAEALTGYTDEEMAGGPVTAYYAPDTADLAAAEIKTLKENHSVTKELAFVRKGGISVPVLVTYSLITENQGEEPYIVEAYSDLTDRKRLDHLKNEFVFIAAHELRSPVTAINLLLNLIFEDRRFSLDPVLRDYLGRLQEAEERLLHLVDDLLEVSRSEVGHLKIKLEPQDITVAVRAVLNDFRANALGRDVTLKYDAPAAALPAVLSDVNKLREILTNLVSNAIKYNVPGGTVTVTHEVIDGFLMTAVTDTGIGMRPEDQPNLFQKFWRSDDFAVRAQPGTGLGLFIVQELVHRMGGSVSVQSERGRGTTVTFSLPLAKAQSK